MENISWTDRVRNEEALHGVKENRYILHTIKRQRANWIGHILHKNRLLKHNKGEKKDDRNDEKTRKNTYTATG